MKRPVFLIFALICGLGPLQAENWPQFRGPTTQNHANATNLPVTWDESNVTWKTAIPGEAWSSPIVWEDQVFVTSTLSGGRDCHVIAVDAETGKINWITKVFQQEVLRKEGKNSYASPTPATDGERVYAVFNGGGVAPVSLSGDLVWTNEDVRFYSRHGLGASPILHDGKLIMPYDGSQRVDQLSKWPDISPDEGVGWQTPWDKAEVVALDTETGKRVWTGKRGSSRIAHVTPIAIEHDGTKEIVSPAGDVVQGFRP